MTLDEELLKTQAAIANLHALLHQRNTTAGAAFLYPSIDELRKHGDSMQLQWTNSAGGDPVDRLRMAHEDMREISRLAHNKVQSDGRKGTHLVYVYKGIQPVRAQLVGATQMLVSFAGAANEYARSNRRRPFVDEPGDPSTLANATCAVRSLCRGSTCGVMSGLGFTCNDLFRLGCSSCSTCCIVDQQSALSMSRILSNGTSPYACSSRCRNATCGELRERGFSCAEIATLNGCNCHGCCSSTPFAYNTLIVSVDQNERYRHAWNEVRKAGLVPEFSRGIFSRTSRCHPTLPPLNETAETLRVHMTQVAYENTIDAGRSACLKVVQRNTPHMIFEDDIVLTVPADTVRAYLANTTSQYDAVALGGCAFFKRNYSSDGIPQFKFSCGHAGFATPTFCRAMLQLNNDCAKPQQADSGIHELLCESGRMRCAPWMRLPDFFDADQKSKSMWRKWRMEEAKRLNRPRSPPVPENEQWYGFGLFAQRRDTVGKFQPYLHTGSNRARHGLTLWNDPRFGPVDRPTPTCIPDRTTVNRDQCKDVPEAEAQRLANASKVRKAAAALAKAAAANKGKATKPAPDS